MESYQLFIRLNQNIKIKIGKLGLFDFPKGRYIYTGSSKNNIEARVKRHFSKDKKLHWHIDYLLSNDQAIIINVIKSDLTECDLNANVNGRIIVEGFGSSDCRKYCKSHLKYLNRQ